MPFKIVRNDITKMNVDAVVNTSNPLPIYADGSDTAVYKTAGAERLLKEREKIGIIETGQAAVTPAFDLPAKYIIHTVGPVYWNGESGEAEQLYSCYEKSLKLASEYGCESIAFPLISTGTYGYPKNEAMQIALAAISKFLTQKEMMVYLTVFDEESFSVSKKLFADIDSYIDENYVQDVLEYEYLHDGIPKPYAPMFVGNAAAARETAPFYGETKHTKAVERSLDDMMAQLEETFQEKLFRMIDEKGVTDVEIYKKANMSRKLFSKIRCNPTYKPKKITVIALAIALELNLDEAIDLLARAEYALSPSSKFDVIIRYFIEKKVYDIYTINLALFEHGQPLLGD